MKLSVNWLKEYVDTRLNAEKIADRLTMAGLEVDEVISGQSFTGVVVGHVLSVDKHPNADKLNVAQIDIAAYKLQIVCGAANLKVGQLVAVALVGAKLGDYEITKANLRGVDSYGMICSEKELGLGNDHDGIMVLGEGHQIGELFVSDKGTDNILDVSVLANRPDCMSVIGLAREVAVTTGSKSKIPAYAGMAKGDGPKVDFSVTVEDTKLCPRYMARFVTGIETRDSKLETPQWMQERLVSSGVRPISLLVDISNYVMLEYGQPLHFFDLGKLTDKKIVVRPAKAGETITTLDGTKRTLTKENLVIADSKKALALAGVMGGLDTEIDDHTTSILIEAAVFDKASIRRTSRALGLRSEAVARFEKGIPVALPEVALERAVQLLAELAHGQISETVIDIQDKKKPVEPVSFSVWKMNTFLGTSIPEDKAIGVLESLGFVVVKTDEGYDVTSPYWRIDVVQDVDLYEEVIRILGYEQVPYTLPLNVDSVPTANQYFGLASRLRARLSAIGFDEILTYSFIGASEMTAVGVDVTKSPKVQNPLVSDQQHLRSTLVPQMLGVIRDNQFNRDVLRFFEIGKSFEITTAGKLPTETNWLVLGMTTDYYDAKGAVLNLLVSLGLEEGDIVTKSTTRTFIKRGKGADFFVHGKKLCSLGEIREEVREKFDIKRAVVVAELNIDSLLELRIPEVKFVQFSRYQQVTRDVSSVFPGTLSAADISKKLSRADKLITKAEITDIYSGKNLEPGTRSITIRLYIQSADHTLTDAEVDETMKSVHNRLTELGGKLRSGN